jgi:Bacteriophage tail sheath protein
VAEYLAPGVYVEETSFRAKSIEGVGTSTTGFVGLALRGPINKAAFITSFGDFERIFGGFVNLHLVADPNDPKNINYLAHSVQAFFDNGGSRLFVSRVFSGDVNAVATSGAAADTGVRFIARFPGTAGNGRITVTLMATPTSKGVLSSLPTGSLVRSTPGGGGAATYYVTNADGTLQHGADTVKPGDVDGTLNVLTFNVSAQSGTGEPPMVYEGLGFTPSHPRWAGAVLAKNPKRQADQLENLFAIDVGTKVTPDQFVSAFTPSPNSDHVDFVLSGGTDGSEPNAAAFHDALQALEAVEEIAIVAAPGSSIFNDGDGIIQELLKHVQHPRAYRVAVLDAPPASTGIDPKTTRSKIDSTYAAFYYPWVYVSNPLARPEIPNISPEVLLPPSGFVSGIYARNDQQHGVFKAPANEVVLGALRFEHDVNFAEQGILNPLGINCLRFFAGRGFRIWGARTASSDPEWKYINVRRYFVYLEHSIDNSTQWAVFENNGPALWANVRETVETFLYSEWKSGALLGTKPDEAYFVRCDRSTMTQNDLDNGRMVCLIGVAVVKPAEFVIFRIGQKTADAKS